MCWIRSICCYIENFCLAGTMLFQRNVIDKARQSSEYVWKKDTFNSLGLCIAQREDAVFMH